MQTYSIMKVIAAVTFYRTVASLLARREATMPVLLFLTSPINPPGEIGQFTVGTIEHYFLCACFGNCG